MVIRTMAKMKALVSLWYKIKEEGDGKTSGKGKRLKIMSQGIQVAFILYCLTESI